MKYTAPVREDTPGKKRPQGADRRRFCLGMGTVLVTALAGCIGDSDDDASPGFSDVDDDDNDDLDVAVISDDDEADDVEDDKADDDSETVDEDDDDGGLEEVDDGGHPWTADSFELEGTMIHPTDDPVDVYGRVHGDNMYLQFTHADGTVFEIYQIGEDMYTVSPHGCFKPSDDLEETAPTEGMDIGADYKSEEFWDGHEPVDTVTLDGHEVEVYEITQDVLVGQIEHTFWVDVETGYIRQHEEYVPHESVTTTVEHFNWNDADHVAEPEEDCQEI